MSEGGAESHAGFEDPDPPLAEGDAVGEWTIAGPLGAGGTGRVYEALHTTVAKRAAVKVLGRAASLDPRAVGRFTGEARIVNEIGHPNIVQVFGFGRLPDGRHWYAMDLVPGGTLERRLAERGAMGPGEALPILRGIASALDAAHDKGVAHRDVKPDNVLLDGEAETASPRLVDFGLAKLLDRDERGPIDARTETGSIVGTPSYMAPEQSRGGEVDARADTYSFGVLAYRMVTGMLPFTGADPIEILMKHRCDAPRPPSRVRAGLPGGLDGPLLAMLDKRPERRPPRLGPAVDELARAWTTTPARSLRRALAVALAIGLALVASGLVALHAVGDAPPPRAPKGAAARSADPRAADPARTAAPPSSPAAPSPARAGVPAVPAATDAPVRPPRRRGHGPEDVEDPYR